MANNDYWAYLKNENELKHYRTPGSKNGESKYSWYKPIGEKAKGVLDASGRYIYDMAKNISSRVNKGVHDAATVIRNKRMESKRTNYGDMADRSANTRWRQADAASRAKRPGAGGYTEDIMKYDRPQDYMNSRKAEARRQKDAEWDVTTMERPQDAMKNGQEERRAYVAKGVAEVKAVIQDLDKYQKALDAEGTEHDKPQYDMFRRKLKALDKKYGNDSTIAREIEKWLAEIEKREASLARNTANMQRWGYKD